MGFKTLEEIQAYQTCRTLKLEVYRLIKSRPDAARDLLFRDQIFNASSSAEVNIAEGFSRFSPGEFVQFLRISRASVAEVVNWLQDGIDREYFTDDDVALARSLADSARRLLTALILSLKRLPGTPPSPPDRSRPKARPRRTP